jgi:hypothetical protein
MKQNGDVMKKLLKFVEDNIMVETFGLIADGGQHRTTPLVIECLTALLKVCRAGMGKERATDPRRVYKHSQTSKRCMLRMTTARVEKFLHGSNDNITCIRPQIWTSIKSLA